MNFHNFQVEFWPDNPAGTQLTISDQTSVQISHLESIWNFPTKTTSTPPIWCQFQHFPAIAYGSPQAHTHTHSMPKQKSIIRPQLHVFTISHQENILSHTQPTTNFSFPPILLALSPPILHLTHGLYQAAFAAPQVTLHFYYRLDPTSGSSPV